MTNDAGDAWLTCEQFDRIVRRDDRDFDRRLYFNSWTVAMPNGRAVEYCCRAAADAAPGRCPEHGTERPLQGDPDDAVAAIDAALEAWESGPDAYQWEPDAEPGEARGVRPNLLAEYGAMMPTQAEIERIGEQMRRAMEGFRVSVQHLAARYREITIAELNARSGVGNSSWVPESTNTPEGPQNGTQGRTGASQREPTCRNRQEAP